MARPIGTRALETPRKCTFCRTPTEFGTVGGRGLHPSCQLGFELFHPEAVDEQAEEANVLFALTELGARVLAVTS